MKSIVCKVCGCYFHGVKENHYISRDEQETGVSTTIKKQEPKWYDTFDCPNCGCQCVIQERKRPVEEDKLLSVSETLDTLAEEADKLMEDVKKDEEDNSSCKNYNKGKTTKLPNGVKSYEGICEECWLEDESICKDCDNRRFNSKFKNKGDSL